LILLMGGTSESVTIAGALARAGYPVLISMATEVPLAMHDLPGISLRRGRLNRDELTALIRQHSIAALVDTTHPFAVQAHETAIAAAYEAGVPYLRWLRPPSDLPGYQHLHFAGDHEVAARVATAFAQPILLTIGSKNLQPYVAEARRTKLPIYARVLPCEDAQLACREVAIYPEDVIFARGPFSTDDTLRLLRERHIGVLVTKESGAAGGVPEKIQACAIANCACVVVRRAGPEPTAGCSSISELLAILATHGLSAASTIVSRGLHE
jgi:precorrin-6A/cobalt-precorrin-6A reductase